MEVIIGKNAGFCCGVEFTINKAKEILKQEKNVYCLGEIIHNEQVVKELEENGMKTVKDIDEIPENSVMIIRAHGEPISTYKKAEKKNLIVKDLTCANVKVIHNKVQKEKENSFIIIVGVKNHPETIGTLDFAGDNSYVIENEEDILDCYMEYEKTSIGRIFVVSQTTFSRKKFDELSAEIETNFCEAEIIIDKTICNSTEDRQLEAIKMSKECDIMLIVGGKNSSNTRKLFEICNQNCNKAYYIQTIDDVKNIELEKKYRIGIMAGASTPKYIIEEIKQYLERKEV